MSSLIASGLTIALVCLCVLLHFEALNILTRLLPTGYHRRRSSLVLQVLGLLLVHIAEIWIFGAGVWLLVEVLGIGSIVGDVQGLPDYVYFSAMIYTTVGFGDLVPLGPLRVLAGTEAVTGLALITWSASYTFILMRRVWEP